MCLILSYQRIATLTPVYIHCIVYTALPHKGCLDPLASPTPPPILTLKQSSTYIEIIHTKFISLLIYNDLVICKDSSDYLASV